MSDYPEHDKQRAVVDKSQAIGEFVDWLSDTKGIHLAHDVAFKDVDWRGREIELEPRLSTFGVPRIIDLLAEFFGIDLAKIEAEKRQMLDALRAANA